MKPSPSIVILPLISILLLSCRETPEEASRPPKEIPAALREQTIAKGNAACAKLMTSLSTQLKAAIQEGGPIAAVKVCQQVAQPLTHAAGAESKDLTISRTSLKYRNPANAPSAEDRVVLEAWEKLLSEGGALPDHQLVSSTPDSAVFYKPIITQDLCLKCHGTEDSMDPELIKTIDELYPDDKARGYRENELRGAFRVEMNLLVE